MKETKIPHVHGSEESILPIHIWQITITLICFIEVEKLKLNFYESLKI